MTLFYQRPLDKYLFQNKKSKNIIVVEGEYIWQSDTFIVRYLGRVFRDTDKPSIGNSWSYIGNAHQYDLGF